MKRKNQPHRKRARQASALARLERTEANWSEREKKIAEKLRKDLSVVS